MKVDCSNALRKKKPLPVKQFLIFPNEKPGSSSPNRGSEKRYYLNSNFNAPSVKNLFPPFGSTLVSKNGSKRSIDRSNLDVTKKPTLNNKLRIVPRQTVINVKQLILKDLGSSSPPKDLRTLTTLNRTRVIQLAERPTGVSEQVPRNGPPSAQQNAATLPPKLNRLRIVSRDRVAPEQSFSRPPDPNGVSDSGACQKEPLLIKRQAGGVSPKTRQRIEFCVKMDKMASAKARSIDPHKAEEGLSEGVRRRRANCASEDKDQTKYVVGERVLGRSPKGGEGLPPTPVPRDNATNAVLASLQKRLQESEEVRGVADAVRTAFAGWKDGRSLELLSFKTPPDFYQIKRKIGKGCFGKVYLATQVLTGCDVALKVIAKTNIKNKDTRRKIEKEVAILKTVDQSNYVIRLYEVFEDEANVYLAFEYLPNGDLVQFFKKTPLFDEAELAPFFFKILKGVRYLHSRRVLHRDIKLDNILLDKHLGPKLCDFGISSVVEPDCRIFDTGGTPAYLAPEVIKAEGNVCEKSDVWSLGVLLYLLTFGVVPFKANDMQVLYNKIIVGTFKFPELDDISAELVDLIRRMMVVDIDKRLSLEQVMRHPWFRRFAFEKTKESNVDPFKAQAVSQGVASYLGLVGFPEDFVSRSLNGHLFNHIKACSDTLRAKFLKQ